jgi:hypothetical protein
MGCRHPNGCYVGSDLRYLPIIVVAYINGQLVEVASPFGERQGAISDDCALPPQVFGSYVAPEIMLLGRTT